MADGKLMFKLNQNYRRPGKGTDVSFVCNEGTVLHAHKRILRCASRYFKELFLGSSEEVESSNVETDFDPRTMAKVLDFAYHPENEETLVVLSDLDHADNLLKAAHKFSMGSLFRTCCYEIVELATTDDFSRIIHWNKLYKRMETERLLHDYAVKFWEIFLDSEQELYLQCDFEQFSLVATNWAKSQPAQNMDPVGRPTSLHHDMLRLSITSHRQEVVPSPEVGETDPTQVMIQKIIKWIEQNRKRHTEFLLSLLQLESLPRSSMRALLEIESVKTNCEVLVQLFNSVLQPMSSR